MSALLRLCRPKHYLKNVLLFLPLIFAGSSAGLGHVFAAFCGFCLLCSAVYVFNDLNDLEADRRHPVKCKRPLASGAVSVPAARVMLAALLAAGWVLLFLACRSAPLTLLVPLLYLLLNLIYTLRLKTWVLADVAVLASGYLLRLLIGSGVTGIAISPWLYLVVLSASLFLSLGKRMGELREGGGQTRAVLDKYPDPFLRDGLTLFGGTAIVFYALWACSDTIQAASGPYMLWSVPLIIFLYLRYRYLLDCGSSGDPVEVILGDRPLLVMGGVYVLYLLLVYGGVLPPLS